MLLTTIYKSIVLNMPVIAPPQISRDKNVKQDKGFLKEALISKTREIIRTEDGRQMTVAQAMADRLLNVALYAESNTDMVAAQKLVYERIYGKAAIEKVEETKEMPRVVFALGDTGLEKIEQASKLSVPEEPDTDEAMIHVETEDGEEMLV